MQRFYERAVRSRTHVFNFIVDFGIVFIAAKIVYVPFYKGWFNSHADYSSFNPTDILHLHISERDKLFLFVLHMAIFWYYFLMETLFNTTFGKICTRTSIIMREDGSDPKLYICFYRSLIRVIPILNLFDAVSYLSPTEEGIHDRWCGTKLKQKNVKIDDVDGKKGFGKI